MVHYVWIIPFNCVLDSSCDLTIGSRDVMCSEPLTPPVFVGFQSPEPEFGKNCSCPAGLHTTSVTTIITGASDYVLMRRRSAQVDRGE